MVASVEETSTQADVAVYVDEDQEKDYDSLEGAHRLFFGPRIGQCRSLNALVKKSPGYEVYGSATDDCRFETPGWDRWVLETARSFSGGIGLIAPDSGQSKPRMDFPWATARWIEVVGSFSGLDTYHSYWDVGLQLLGEATNIRFAKPDEFKIWHEGLMMDDSVDTALTDVGKMVFSLYHIHNDARTCCVWMAHERQALVDKLRAAMNGKENP
jgi:hypothetical protein